MESQTRTTDGIPEPTPWYRTQVGETAISIGGLLLALASYGVNELLSLPTLASEAVAAVGVVGFIVMFVFSGRAATKAAGEMFGGR